MAIASCWNFGHEEQPPYPTITVTLSSAGRRTNLNAKVDTGFNGSLAIGREAVRRLRLTPTGTILVRVATGPQEVPLYAVNLSQSDLSVDYAVLAIGTDRSLVGRQLLKNRVWLLDCKEGRLCLMTDTRLPGPAGTSAPTGH